MFDQALLDNSTRRAAVPWTMSLSVILQATILTTAILLPLLRIEPLPPVHLVEPKLPPPHMQLVKVPEFVRELFRSGKLSMPTATAVRTITLPTNKPAAHQDLIIEGLPNEVASTSTGNTTSPDLSLFSNKQPVPEPPKQEPKPDRPAVQPVTQQTYRVGGDVKSPSLKSAPPPPYPALAKSARIQGTVRLNGIISRDGTVRSLELISGHPMLVQAALNAVRTWLYEPARLNGQPVDVILVIDVNFKLTQ